MSVDKSESRIRRMFAEISPRYDFLNHFLSGGTDHYWRWKTVRTVAPTDDAPILDVCSGTGDLAIAYWKRTKGRVRVVGTDFTPEMLEHANRKMAKKCDSHSGNSPVTFLAADTQLLPFDDNLFQIVSVAFGLRNVSNHEAGLREMIRVCRPGGRVAVLEFSMPTNPILGRVYRSYFRHVLPRIGQLLARNRHAAYNYLPQSVAQFPEGEALAEILEACGLQNVAWKPLTFGVATLYYGSKPSAVNASRETNPSPLAGQPRA